MNIMNKRVAEESDEEIIEEVRQHPIMLFGPFSKLFVGFIIVVLIFIIFKASFIFSIAFFIWVIFGGIYAFYHYYIWKKDKYILTDSRIIVKEQKTLFSKQVSEANLNNITDVTYNIKGIWATFFNYGTVEAETASSDPLKLKNVAKPHKIQELILDLRKRNFEATNHEITARELLNRPEETKNPN